MKLNCLPGMLTLFILAGLSAGAGYGNAQVSESDAEIVTNLNIADRLIEESFIELGDELVILGKDNLYMIRLNGTGSFYSYFKEKFRQIFADYRIIYGEVSDSANYIIYLDQAVITPRYNKIFSEGFLGTRKAEREILIKFSVKIVDAANSRVVYEKNFTKRFKDDFDLDKELFIEDRRYDFTQADLPEESFMGKFLVPVLVITASAAAIILFFSIRSK